jgi:hypothetical protein
LLFEYSYVEKVSKKYNLSKEKLLNNLETDKETLRKRQKRINFGKVTPEYQRYILAVSKYVLLCASLF